MRDHSADSLTPGGLPAPQGARGAPLAKADARPDGPDGPAVVRAGEGRRTPSLSGLGVSTRHLVVLLVVCLAGYAAIAADVVHAGRLTALDRRVAARVAGSMPSWIEWLARPFTWIGGAVGLTLVVAAVIAWLLRRRARAEAVLLFVVALGIQVLVFTGKNGYERPRPDVGSAIALPSSFSFPSGHAAGGFAVFGLLGLYAGTLARKTRERAVAIGAGLALAALIGASRVALNVHYVTDVVAGALLGLGWLSVCLLVALLLRR